MNSGCSIRLRAIRNDAGQSTAPIAAPPRVEEENGQRFHRTLRCFLHELIKMKAIQEGQLAALDPLLPALLDGVDFSGACGTLVASIPSSAINLEHNGCRGLSAALGRYKWPDGARLQPITYITGALGNIMKDDWLRLDFLKSATAGGAHAFPGSFPELRFVWPDNATVFAGAKHVAQSLGHDWRYYRVTVSLHVCHIYMCDPHPAPPAATTKGSS